MYSRTLAWCAVFVMLVSSTVGWGWGGNSAEGNSNLQCQSPCVPGSEDIMSQKEHGTSHTPVQETLRWNCDWATADRICNYNRHYAEYSGYWETTSFLSQTNGAKEPVTFYDSNTGKPLFKAPKGRSWEQFLEESRSHGWPSFRDSEVNWEYVRVLSNGETVSVDGTHLGTYGSTISYR
jgi:hypothetical protein